MLANGWSSQKEKPFTESLNCVSPFHPLHINLFWESMLIEDTGEETILSQPGIKNLRSLIGNVVMHPLDFIKTSPLKAA